MFSLEPLNSFRKSKLNLPAIGLIFGLSLLLYICIYMFNIPTDIPSHMQDIEGVRSGMRFPPHFLFFLLIDWLTFYTTDRNVLIWTTYVILAIAIVAKYLVSKNFLNHYFERTHFTIPVALTAGLLLIAFSIPISWPNVYLGYFPPNYWHNSTAIFTMPFGVLLFWLALAYLKRPELSTALWAGLFAAICTFGKPSMVYPFLPIYPILLLLSFPFNKRFFEGLIPVLIGGGILAYQWFGPSAGGGDGDGFLVAPFRLWFVHAWYPPFFLVASIFFPLVVFFSYWRFALTSRMWWLAAGMFGVALLVYILLIEKGTRELHGNFGWAVGMTNYLLFLASLAILGQKQSSAQKTKATLCWIAFGLHVAAGIFYFGKIFATGRYL